MSVYFMQASDGGPVKIGSSKNIEQRRKQLESDYKRSLVILRIVEGGRKEEQAIHEQFSHLSLGNELFQPGPDLMEFIGRPLLAGANPEAVVAFPNMTRSFVSFKGTMAMEAWIDGLVDHTHQGTRALLVKNALREYAERHGYEKPQPRR